MRLQPACAVGSPEVMLDCLIEEYAHMGWNRDSILQLFDDPFFQATHGLKALFADRTLEDRVDHVLARCGVIRCSVSQVSQEPVEEQWHV